MEFLAQAFDQPFDSKEHRSLAEAGWLGGPPITVRYWLGRCLRRNLFRESHDYVAATLQQFFVDRGCPKGARLLADYQTWSAAAILLQNDVEFAAGERPTKKRRQVAALNAIMADPESTNAQLAELANTTEKQVARMCEVAVLRKVWNRLQGESTAPD